MPFVQLQADLDIVPTDARGLNVVLDTLASSSIVDGTWQLNTRDTIPYYKFLKNLLIEGELPLRSVIGFEVIDPVIGRGTEIFKRHPHLKESTLELALNLAKLVFPSKVANNAIHAVGMKKGGKGLNGCCYAHDVLWLSGNKPVEPITNPYLCTTVDSTDLWVVTKRNTGTGTMLSNRQHLTQELSAMFDAQVRASKYIPITSKHYLRDHIAVLPCIAPDPIQIRYTGTLDESHLNDLLSVYFSELRDSKRVETVEDVTERNYRDKLFWIETRNSIGQALGGSSNGAGSKAFKAILEEIGYRHFRELYIAKVMGNENIDAQEKNRQIAMMPRNVVQPESIEQVEAILNYTTMSEAIEDLSSLKNVSTASAKIFLDKVSINFKRRLA